MGGIRIMGEEIVTYTAEELLVAMINGDPDIVAGAIKATIEQAGQKRLIVWLNIILLSPALKKQAPGGRVQEIKKALERAFAGTCDRDKVVIFEINERSSHVSPLAQVLFKTTAEAKATILAQGQKGERK
jgi:hypothetical protein